MSFVATRALLADDEPAELVTVQDVGADVRAELAVTWERFAAAFPARMTCIDDVRVELVRAVEGGDARYVIDEGRIEIKIPTSPARFRESVAHELAHHVEHTCAEFAGLQAALRTRFGDADHEWGPVAGRPWEQTPSERWAEAFVELVNGERIRHVDDVVVDADVVALIGAWGRGESSP